MATNTVSDYMTHLIPEVWAPQVDYWVPDLSPLHKRIIASSKGVGPGQLGSTSWQCVKTFMLGLGGAAEWGGITGPNIATEPDTSTPADFNMLSAQETWPGVNEATLPAFAQRTISLKRLKLNFYIHQDLFRWGDNPNAVDDPVAIIIMQTARRAALMQCQAFWAQPSNQSGIRGRIATIRTPGSSEDITPTGVTYALATAAQSAVDGQSIRMLEPGTIVDLYQEDGNVRANTHPVVVGAVDALGHAANSEGNIKLYSTAGETVDLTANEQYELTFRNSGREAATASTAKLPTALDQVVTSTGTNVYGVNVATYPILKSHTRDFSGTILDEQELLKDFALYERARGSLFSLDTIVTTAGVMAGMFNDLMGVPSGSITSGGADTLYGASGINQRNGAAVTVRGGVNDGVTFTLFGRTYNLIIDPMCPSGVAYGLRMRNNNWKYLRPPRLSKSQSKTGMGFDKSLEFLAPSWGYNGIFMSSPMVGGGNAGAPTNTLMAPAEMWGEYVPDVIPGLKLYGISEIYG